GCSDVNRRQLSPARGLVNPTLRHAQVASCCGYVPQLLALLDPDYHFPIVHAVLHVRGQLSATVAEQWSPQQAAGRPVLMFVFPMRYLARPLGPGWGGLEAASEAEPRATQATTNEPGSRTGSTPVEEFARVRGMMDWRTYFGRTWRDQRKDDFAE